MHPWKQHFENLLGNPQKLHMSQLREFLVNKLRKFTQDVLDSALRKMENRKAAWLDKKIPPEVGEVREFDDILFRHCNIGYNQNTIDR